MNRRTTLKLLSTAIATAGAAIVAIPGFIYSIAAVRRRKPGGSVVQRVARWKDLAVGRPVLLTLTGSRRDAWTVYAAETIGRVWVVRRSDETMPPADSQVDAYSAVCPHLGCSIQWGAGSENFLCPCHKAGFDLAGKALSDEQLGHKNPTPRGMDALACRIVQDADSGQWWVEVTYEKFQYGLTDKVATT